MTKQMSKDQRALAKILDALDGTDSATVRRLLRSAAIFHEVQVDDIRYVPQIVDRYRPYWAISAPVWSCGSTQTIATGIGSAPMTSGDARYQVTGALLDASVEGQ